MEESDELSYLGVQRTSIWYFPRLLCCSPFNHQQRLHCRCSGAHGHGLPAVSAGVLDHSQKVRLQYAICITRWRAGVSYNRPRETGEKHQRPWSCRCCKECGLGSRSMHHVWVAIEKPNGVSRWSLPFCASSLVEKRSSVTTNLLLRHNSFSFSSTRLSRYHNTYPVLAFVRKGCVVADVVGRRREMAVPHPINNPDAFHALLLCQSAACLSFSG